MDLKALIGVPASKCSPSPFGRWLDGTIVSAEKGKIVAEFTVRDEFANPGNIMHGGAIAGIIDEVMGITSFTLQKEGFYVAINLNVDFLRPGIMGTKLKVVSEIIKDGRTMAHGICNVYDQNDKLIAKASSNLALTNQTNNR